jgi:hypothetical protein
MVLAPEMRFAAQSRHAVPKGEKVLTILAIWTLLSLPLSVIVGFSIRDDKVVELVGMDGNAAVYRRADGSLQRMPLVDRTAA